MSEEHAIALEGVVKRYGDVVAVNRLSFAARRGAIYGILGPNGSGKTTTLRMINDIIAPDEGRIELLGGLLPGRQAATRIGYLPEERGLYPKMRVAEILQFFGELRGLAAADAKRRAHAWLERLELSNWATKRVRDLSKGMQQKVQFAASILHEPELVILDEPWSGLDPLNAEVLREIVAEQRQAGRTVLFSTHLMEQAEKLCDSVCIIARGTKVLDGDLEQIKRDLAPEGRVAVAFPDVGSRDRAKETVFADRSLVHGFRENRDACHVELEPGRVSDQLLAALVSAKVSIKSFELIEPTLHEIFVERVGADFNEEVATDNG